MGAKLLIYFTSAPDGFLKHFFYTAVQYGSKGLDGFMHEEAVWFENTSTKQPEVLGSAAVLGRAG